MTTRIPPGELPAEIAAYRGDPQRPCLVVARKAGKTEFDGLQLEALQQIADCVERIAGYYATLPPLRG